MKNLNNYLTDIADAIREKDGTQDKINAIDYPDRIRNIKSGGEVNINGIIEEYEVAAGENISAGDFVGFVNEYNKASVIQNNLYLGSTEYLRIIGAQSVSENLVVITYSASSSSAQTYATLISVDNGKMIMKGTTMIMNLWANSGRLYKCKNNVFIQLYDRGNSYYFYFSSFSVDIEKMTITAHSGTIHSQFLYTSEKGQQYDLIDFNNKQYMIYNVDGYGTYVGELPLNSNGSLAGSVKYTQISTNGYGGRIVVDGKLLLLQPYNTKLNYGILDIDENEQFSLIENEIQVDSPFSSSGGYVDTIGLMHQNKDGRITFVCSAHNSSYTYKKIYYSLNKNENNVSLSMPLIAFSNNPMIRVKDDSFYVLGQKVNYMEIRNDKVYSYSQTAITTTYDYSICVKINNFFYAFFVYNGKERHAFSFSLDNKIQKSIVKKDIAGIAKQNGNENDIIEIYTLL